MLRHYPHARGRPFAHCDRAPPGSAPRHRGREPVRNRNLFGQYHYHDAQRQMDERGTCASQWQKRAHGALGETLRDGLRNRWSPKHITGRLQHNIRMTTNSVSPRRRSTVRSTASTRSVTTGAHGCSAAGRVGIEQRSAVRGTRRRFGDRESDTIEGGKGRGTAGHACRAQERHVRLGRFQGKRAAMLSAVSHRALRDLPAMLRRTLTAVAEEGRRAARYFRYGTERPARPGRCDRQLLLPSIHRRMGCA